MVTPRMTEVFVVESQMLSYEGLPAEVRDMMVSSMDDLSPSLRDDVLRQAREAEWERLRNGNFVGWSWERSGEPSMVRKDRGDPDSEMVPNPKRARAYVAYDPDLTSQGRPQREPTAAAREIEALVWKEPDGRWRWGSPVYLNDYDIRRCLGPDYARLWGT